MSIFDQRFAVYERLASIKMNQFEDAINSHIHDGLSGTRIRFENLDGDINTVATGFNVETISGTVIITNTLPATSIVDASITMQQINNNIAISNSLKLSSTGYAVYAP
jgi:hypothetical protein